MPTYNASTISLSSRTSSHKSSASLRRQASRPELKIQSSHLRPEDAFYHPRGFGRESSPLGRSDTITQHGGGSSKRASRGRSSSRRRRAANGPPGGVAAARGTWKKLLWVKQAYPDNYTDEATFLDHLQRNPRWRPYEFWPLVADSTIIVQHLCSVTIFVCCFTGIFQERVSPGSVVGWATLCTVASWVFRDSWQSREHQQGADSATGEGGEDARSGGEEQGDGEERWRRTTGEDSSVYGSPVKGELDLASRRSSLATSSNNFGTHSRGPSGSSLPPSSPAHAYANSPLPPVDSTISTTSSPIRPWRGKPSVFSARAQERLTTVKSAVLIYAALLGLSPILKSLTLSTSSDSIWALASWLMVLNVFTFDYGAGPEAKFPASLSTNAALMASTVLASRLPSTTHVFSLTLFSIEVFGLFPVFRRHLRHHSWEGHLFLTIALVVLAGGGLSMTISGGGWAMGVLGVGLGGVITCLGMGLTSWWLIGLQRYKNEIHGPWDPARPVIRMMR